MKKKMKEPNYTPLNGEFCTLAELAAAMNMSPRTVAYWADGELGRNLKTTTIGVSFRIVEKSEVQRIIAEVKNG
jgi:hypothetical protein